MTGFLAPTGHQNHDRQRIELTPQPASMARGLCVGHPDPDLWHPGRYDHARRDAAVSICKRCPALADCREWSLSLPVRNGAVYGGRSYNERLGEVKRRAAAR